VPAHKEINTEERLEFDMTPMIDCCFQLIIFFMLTLRYASPEGDFNIKMPLAQINQVRPDDALPTIRVRLKANPDGRLGGIQMNDRAVASFRELQQIIRALVGGARPAGGETPGEVELDCDYRLRWEYTVAAIGAVSGYLADDGKTVVKLIEKVKIAPPRME